MAEPGGGGLRVLAAGLLTTVQDLGRFGFGRFGLPTAGALDDHALRWANLLAGNPPGAAALEITLLGPTLALEGDRPVLAALAGADCAARLDGAALPPWRGFRWPPGATLALGACREGARAYLALAGGAAVPPAFGSRSTDTLGRLGGIDGRALRRGDLVPLAPPSDEAPARGLPPGLRPRYGQEIALRVVLGPQEERFTPAALDTFLSAAYTVGAESDRMGMRLDGPALAFRAGPAGADILSEGVVSGAVQVPAQGRPILLLVAHQTTGGYAKIATVIGADLWRLGQARPGARLRFRAVAVEEAQAALAGYMAGFDPAVLVPAEPAAAPALTPGAARRLTAEVAALAGQVERLGLAELGVALPGAALRLRRATGEAAGGRRQPTAGEGRRAAGSGPGPDGAGPGRPA